GDEGDGLLLAGGHEDVEFPLAGVFREFLGHADEAVSNAGHGGNNSDDLIACVAGALDAGGDVADAVDAADRSAAVFLNNESHGCGAGSEGGDGGLGKTGKSATSQEMGIASEKG